MRSSYPSLLGKKATLVGGLTRADLAVVGASYLMLSWMKVSGLLSLLIVLVVLGGLALIKKFLMPGFFSQLIRKKSLNWRNSLENVYE